MYIVHENLFRFSDMRNVTGKNWLNRFTWLLLVMSFMVFFVLSFSHEMSRMKSGT